ncbi:MAG: hypothetical protein HY962_14450 [Ignavibacteriae bacterium]|nr:hypothetical protein [Ignavibacteriota bacterium]
MMGYQRDKLIGHTPRELEFWADPRARTAASSASTTSHPQESGGTICSKKRSLRTSLSWAQASPD